MHNFFHISSVFLKKTYSWFLRSNSVETEKTSNEESSKAKKPKKRKYGTLKASAPDSPISSISGSSCCGETEPNLSLQTSKKKVTTTKADKVTVFGDKDVRAKYAGMFSEAFNDFDKVRFAQLVRDHCEEDLVVIYEYVGGVNPYGTPNYIEVRGFETVVVFWDGLLTAIPDSLFQVHSTKYKILPNDFTSIVCTFSFVGTKVYELRGLAEDNKSNDCVVSSDPQSCGDNPEKMQQRAGGQQIIVTAYKAGPGTGNTLISGEGAGKKILSQKHEGNEQSFAVERSAMISKKVTIIGTLTYYVNATKKIYQMSFVHSMKQ